MAASVVNQPSKVSDIESTRSYIAGPMRAAWQFATELRHSGVLEHVARLSTQISGSLVLHLNEGVDTAIVLGLLGEQPDQLEVRHAQKCVDNVLHTKVIPLLQLHDLSFELQRDVHIHPQLNTQEQYSVLHFIAFNPEDDAVHQRMYYLDDNGVIVDEAFLKTQHTDSDVSDEFAHFQDPSNQLLN